MIQQLTFIKTKNGILYPEHLFLDRRDYDKDQSTEYNIVNPDQIRVAHARIIKPPYKIEECIPEDLKIHNLLENLSVEPEYRRGHLATLLLRISQKLSLQENRGLFTIPFSKEDITDKKLKEFYLNHGFLPRNDEYFEWNDTRGEK